MTEQRRGKLLKLVRWPDPVLRTAAPEFDFSEPATDPIELAYDLVETMLSKKGLGLAACQVGLPYRVFAMACNPVLVLFNPRIVDQDVEQVELDEGCLTFPGLSVKVKRSGALRARFSMPNGEVVTRKFVGITARVFQHELDHLDGLTFFDRLDRIHRERAQRKWKSLSRRIKGGRESEKEGVGDTGRDQSTEGIALATQGTA